MWILAIAFIMLLTGEPVDSAPLRASGYNKYYDLHRQPSKKYPDTLWSIKDGGIKPPEQVTKPLEK